jgi:hypothetical protein
MGDIKSAKLLILQRFLFLVTGLLACAGYFSTTLMFATALLLAVAIWSFCRLY